ncbi:uncharacterized protein LOC107362965 isoform X2 [Tetranychus urticae]|uniref:uncharacterized protein LOC107362965 isoform X2 n=1 Tax=Tetranychus urticae TaxID=32264 RepID=UPI00077C01C2|nr:uncharacterized protein LOC107362965 isoform X2 [Tetranychus urticae]
MMVQQSKGLIFTTTIIVMITLIKFVSTSGNNNNQANNLESNDFQAVIQRPYLDHDNRLTRYLIDRFAPFIIARTAPIDESSFGLADLVRKENRFKKMFLNYDDMIPISSDHYNKKDNSVYKDAFVGVRG